MSASLAAAIANIAPQAVRSAECDVGDCDIADIDAADGLSADDGVYDEIEALLHDDLPRQGCVELAQALEEVMALLRPGLSEFSHPAAGASPIGRVPVAP